MNRFYCQVREMKVIGYRWSLLCSQDQVNRYRKNVNRGEGSPFDIIVNEGYSNYSYFD